MRQAISIFDHDGVTMIGNTALDPHLVNTLPVGGLVKLKGVDYRWDGASLTRAYPAEANRRMRRAAVAMNRQSA